LDTAAAQKIQCPFEYVGRTVSDASDMKLLQAKEWWATDRDVKRVGAARQSLALAILVYFGVIGVLGGYLLTRLFLQRAFAAAGWQDADRL
jgi:hypothetical protein